MYLCTMYLCFLDITITKTFKYRQSQSPLYYIPEFLEQQTTAAAILPCNKPQPKNMIYS